QPACDPLRDPAPSARAGLHPAPHLRAPARAAHDGVAPLPPRRKPRFAGGLRGGARAVSPAAARQARPHRLRLGVLPSPLRRHPLPAARPRQGHPAARGARDERRGPGREPASHGGLRGGAMVSRIITGAHYGLRDWLAQRITAAIMAAYSVILAIVLLTGQPMSYPVWRDLFAQGWMRVATLLFAVSLAWHAWVGMRDILLDYVKPTAARLGLELLTLLLLAVYLGWPVRLRWRGRESGRARVRCDRGGGRRLGHARGARARAREPQGGGALEGVPGALEHRGGAGRHRGPARQLHRGQLALAHVRHGEGLRLSRGPGRHRVHVPPGDRGRGRARAHGHAVRPPGERQDLPAPVRRPHPELRQQQDGDARLRRGR